MIKDKWSGLIMPGIEHEDFGFIDFKDFLTLQESCYKKRTEDKIPDTILFAQHPPTVSIKEGYENRDLKYLRRRPEVLAREGIPIISVRRGGSIAVHGPGILGCYLILRGRPPGIIGQLIDQWIVISLETLGVTASPLPPPRENSSAFEEQYRGVWLGKKKIATRGLFVQRVSKFGVNLNISPELRLLKLIHPCGITDYELGSLEQETERTWPIPIVQNALIENRHLLYGSSLRQHFNIATY